MFLPLKNTLKIKNKNSVLNLSWKKDAQEFDKLTLSPTGSQVLQTLQNN